MFGNRIVEQERLQIPHPRLAERRFVLTPLAEIAPSTVHPILKKTIKTLLNDLKGTPQMLPYSVSPFCPSGVPGEIP
jgi:7,8-dihydro-6-hydroxymethylpterin-pyrophosphokinase